MAEQTIRFDDGAAYERMMGAWSRLVGIEFLDWLAAPAGGRWVDVGCGNGAFTELIATRTQPAAIDAVDPSEGQLTFARQREAARPARFQQGHAMELPFAEDTFDVATMALVISFVPDPPKGVAELVRVTKPGGRVGAYMWDLEGAGLPIEPVQSELTAMGIPSAHAPRPDVSTSPALRRLWEEAGLSDVETRVFEVRRSFESFQDYWEACLSGHLGAAVRGMAPEAVTELRRRVAAKFPEDKDGVVTRTGLAHAVKGRKPA
jgi:SAM-dependent methyltransferase